QFAEHIAQAQRWGRIGQADAAVASGSGGDPAQPGQARDDLVEVIDRNGELSGDVLRRDTLFRAEGVQVHQHAQAVVGKAVQLHGRRRRKEMTQSYHNLWYLRCNDLRIQARCRAGAIIAARFVFAEPPVSDRLAVLPQYLLPKRALTVLMGRLASLRGGRATTAVIRWF